LSITQADLDRQLQISHERMSALWTTARGYLGWLLTNPTFLDEHDALINEHVSVIGSWGTAAFAQPLPPPHFDSASTSEQAAFRVADARFVPFFNRWRLLGLAAPYLPVPMQPQFAGSLPETMLGRYSAVGGLFVIPDTFPVPSRDEFRGLLDDALHGSPPDHLDGWMQIVGAGNTGRQTIPKYARIFVLQHFWRVLHHRHATALRRQVRRLEHVFGHFLQAGAQSIRQDLAEIRGRLGPNWVDRGAESPIGPF